MGEREGFRLLGVRPLYYLAIFLTGLLLAFSNSLSDSNNHGTSAHKAQLVTRERGSLENAVATNYTEPSLFRLANDEEEDYTCSPGKPCSNGACCGATGVCGYGSDYCGDGCSSNCDAHAECGMYAENPGQECPLNVCCSEFGFCGTSSEFCSDLCQSNCESNPQPPPPSGSGGGDILKRVIGYYEGWNARSKCHETKPDDLPVSALTHINFAFAFVDPDTYAIVPMDDKTPTSLFGDTTNLKLINPGLRVFISVGGWTFSDNDTVTQPLLGEISRDAGKRMQFANQIVDFMVTYGFDGLDLDWEYPGAPDRGGKPDDTANMVLLFKSIREAFDRAGRGYELTFTIPASYWYLRWFDMPGLMQYADWTNLMSYDLHGLWDRDNAIGNLVQPHTNLTEIEAAAQLLWRVGIPPDKVALGFGFYGRSFTLEDPDCSEPGCRFSNASRPGVCTDTGGYLAYYEVQDILDKDSDITVHHDKTAAVKYFSWDDDQWISFDDKDTFKQKIDWANEIGMSGALIWASDLDDYTWSAHEGFFGKEIKGKEEASNDATEAVAMEDTSDLTTSELHEDCYRFDECVDRDIVDCDSGYMMVGWDRSDCGDYSKPICCKKKTAPENCQWRGSGGDCNGQCHEGEVTLFESSRGGGFESQSGTGKCNRGHKVFCCEDNSFSDLTSDCRWTGCGGKCDDDEIDVAYAANLSGDCTFFKKGMHYCCKTRDPPFEDCHWVGQGDCADNTCAADEVTLRTHNQGDSISGCAWKRKKALCCTPNLDLLVPASCDEDLCEIDDSFRCGPDPYADDFSDEDLCDPADCFLDDDELDRRDLTANSSASLPRDLVKRGGKRSFDAAFTIGVFSYIITAWSRRYPGSTNLHGRTRSPPASSDVFRRVSRTNMSPHHPRPPTSTPVHVQKVQPDFHGRRRLGKRLRMTGVPGVSGCPRTQTVLRTGTCYSTEIEVIDRTTMTRSEIEDGFDTEHNPDLQYVQALLTSLATGNLPDGTRADTPALDPNDLDNYWNAQVMDRSLTGTGASRGIRTPNDFFMDQFGSHGNRSPFLILQRTLNEIKGRIFGDNVQPQSQRTFEDHLRYAARSGRGEASLFQSLRETIAVFRYINHPDARPRIQANRRRLRDVAEIIEREVPELAGIHALHIEFDNAWYRARTRAARQWVADRLMDITARYSTLERAGRTPRNARQVRAGVDSLFDDLEYMEPPPEDPDDP